RMRLGEALASQFKRPAARLGARIGAAGDGYPGTVPPIQVLVSGLRACFDFPDGHLFHQWCDLVSRPWAVAFDVLVERRPHPLGEQEPAGRRRLLRVDHQSLVVELSRFLWRERRFPALRHTSPPTT